MYTINATKGPRVTLKQRIQNEKKLEQNFHNTRKLVPIFFQIQRQALNHHFAIYNLGL